MASNARFHNKYHRRNHHTLPSAGYPDSGVDPIASPQEPFLGDFHAVGALSATGNLTIGGNTLIYGNLSALGNFSFIDTFVTVTSALSVVNDGTGPAFTVQQKGAQPVAIFFDDSNKIFNLKDGLKAEFFNSQATNTYALAEGQATLAQGYASHSEGQQTIAAANYSHAEGAITTASGTASHAEGESTVAEGTNSHAEGYNTTASGNYSHAQGINNEAAGYASHAQGASNVASNSYSHAQGNTNVASGESSYAGGQGTLASGLRSTATGQETSATKINAYASGKLAFANHNRSWVWQGTNLDDASAQFASTRTDQFAIRAVGGFFLSGAMGINTDSIANALTVVGDVSASRSIVGTSLSGRFVDISHTPANDGNNPYLRIGEATSDAVNFSGFKIEYNETVNDLNLSAIGFNTSREALKITSAGNTRLNLLSAISPNYNNLTAVTRGISGAAIDNLSHLINGRVGVNNQAPVSSYALHVKGGNIRVDGVDYSAVPGFDGTTYDSDGQSLIDLRSATPSASYSLSIAASGQKHFLKFFGGRTKRPGETDNSTFPFVVYQGNQHLRFAKTPDFYFAGGFTEVGKFDASGNFGVGSFNSSQNLPAKLTVTGNISATGTTTTAAVSVLKTNPGADAALTILAGNESGDAASLFFGNNVAVSGHNRGQIRYYNGVIDAMAFSTNSIEAMRIRGNGNVGIGITTPTQKLTVSGNISVLSAVHTIGIPPGVIPAIFKVDGINLLAPVGTRVPVYTVPAGMKFSASGFKLIITSTDASAPFTVGFAPNIAINNSGSVSKLINDVVLSTSYTHAVGNVINQSGGYGGGGANRTFSTDTVGVEIVTPAYAGGGTITALIASVIVTGELFY